MKIYVENGIVYSVDMMLRYVNEMKPIKLKIKSKKLFPQLEEKIWKIGNKFYPPFSVIKNSKKKLFKDHLDRIKLSDISYPIIVKDNYLIVDGMHRLSKIYMDKIKHVYVYKLDEQLMKKFIIHKFDNMDDYNFDFIRKEYDNKKINIIYDKHFSK